MRLHKEVIRGSIILLLGFGLYNFFNFAFQFAMARLLTLSDYSILAAIFSITYILAIFTETMQTVITKYVSSEKNQGRVKGLVYRTLRKTLFIALVLFSIFLLFAVPLSYALAIPYMLLFMSGLFLFPIVMLPITRGILQGKKRFGLLSVTMIVESGLKVVLGIVFVYWGFSVYGALGATFIGLVLAVLVSYLFIAQVLGSVAPSKASGALYNFAKPAFFITLAIIIFYSIDTILARLFFSPEVSGIYAVASILSKIIFWGTLPISKAMFPLSSENTNNKKALTTIFINALMIICLGLIVSLVVFYFFSYQIVELFSGKYLPEAAEILIYLSMGTGFLAITNLIWLYRLSIGRVSGYHFLWIFVLLEIVLLSVFSGSLVQFSIAFLASSIALLWGSVQFIKK